VFDTNCTVPEVAIKAHDMSASNQAPAEVATSTEEAPK
jgi:hypothetical protein